MIFFIDDYYYITAVYVSPSDCLIAMILTPERFLSNIDKSEGSVIFEP